MIMSVFGQVKEAAKKLFVSSPFALHHIYFLEREDQQKKLF